MDLAETRMGQELPGVRTALESQTKELAKIRKELKNQSAALENISKSMEKLNSTLSAQTLAKYGSPRTRNSGKSITPT